MSTEAHAHAPMGMTVKQTENMVRIELRCAHLHGQAYMVRGERSWVCDDTLLHAHVLAGFLHELTTLHDPQVQAAMQRWGLYFRELPIEDAPEAPAKAP